MRKSIETFLSMQPSHVKLLSLLGLGVLFKSISSVWMDATAATLYLQEFGTGDLAFAFLMSAVFLSLGGWLSVSMDRRFGAGILYFLGGAIAVQSILCLGMTYGWRPAVSLFFALKYTYNTLLAIGFWGLALRFIVIDLNSRKFLLIVLLDFLGLIIGGAGLILLGLFANVQMIAWLNIWVGIALFMIFKTTFSFQEKTPKVMLKKNGGVDEASQIKLMYLIYSASVLFSLIYALVDYVLYVRADAAFASNLSFVADFLGGVWMLVGMVSIVLLLTFYRVRNRFHVMQGILVLALVPLLVYIGWQFQILALLLIAKVLFEIVRYFCVQPYFRLVPRPLTHGSRPRLKIFRLAVCEPMGVAIMALTFFFLPMDRALLPLAISVSGAFVLVLFLTQSEYAKVLLSSFKTFRWRGGRLLVIHKDVIHYVMDRANSRDADEAIYFLRVLEESRSSLYVKALRQALKHPSENVRTFALDRIAKYAETSLSKPVSDVLGKDESIPVKQAALRALCSLQGCYSDERAMMFLGDEQLRKGALISLLKGGQTGVLVASEDLNKLVLSKSNAKRLEAAEILEETAIKGFYRLIQTLMQDKNNDVRRVAILAAGRIAHPALLPEILKAISDLDFRDTALQSLMGYGPKAYLFILQSLLSRHVSRLAKKALISFLWISEDSQAKNVLIEALPRANFEERFDILRHLKGMHWHWVRRHRKQVLIPLIEKDKAEIESLLSFMKGLSLASTHESGEANHQLNLALQHEYDQLRKTVLMELILLYRTRLFQEAGELLLRRDTPFDAWVAAAGFVEDMLPKSWASLRDVIRAIPLEDQLEKMPMPIETQTSQLAGLIANTNDRNAWTRACALYYVRKLNDPVLLPAVLGALKDPHPLVREGAVWAYARLEANKRKWRSTLKDLAADPVPSVRLAMDAVLKG